MRYLCRRHKLELKMWTLLGGAVACAAVAYQFSLSTAWFDNASTSQNEAGRCDVAQFPLLYAR